MEVAVLMLGLVVFGVVVLLPLFLLGRVWSLQRQSGEMRDRLAELEARLARLTLPEAVPPPADLERLPDPIPLPERPPEATAPAPLPPAVPTAAATPPAAVAPVATPRRGPGFEHLVGGVWLQHAGSVLILFGAFFLILWGYTTGRLGAGVLVGAGAAVGLVIAWRGDRIARGLPGFGQALVGVGLGIVWLSLYLGHFVLHVLPTWPAFALLALVSLGTVTAGLRHRAQPIAALGLVGAFVPLLLSRMLPMRGFSMTPEQVLGYLALVNGFVFALAARAGWSGLSLSALALAAITWIAAAGSARWGWGLQAGLTALFAGLGLALLPRMARAEGRVGPTALAVIAAAPLCWIAASWPFLSYVSKTAATACLIVMALVYLLAALWVDVRRPERDLWRPLTGAATLFLTAGLQRMLGPDHTPMAWCVEGAVLVELGLGARGGWLRFMGQLVLLLGGLWVLVGLLDSAPRGVPPFVNPDALRDLTAFVAIGWVAWRLAARRDDLSPAERQTSEVWGAVANLMLMVWSVREMHLLARAIEGGRLPVPESAGGTPLWRRVSTLSSVLTSGAWTVQALALVIVGWARGAGFLRWLGMGLLGITVFKLLFADLRQVDVFWRFLLAIVLGAALLGVSYLYQRRARQP